ncbi:MAG: hypothetical protein U0Z53_31260 [Blastocatellia bacterium]
MNQPDEISRQLDEIARLLEANGYDIEVSYSSATIIVRTEHWPIAVEVSNRKSEEQE